MVDLRNSSPNSILCQLLFEHVEVVAQAGHPKRRNRASFSEHIQRLATTKGRLTRLLFDPLANGLIEPTHIQFYHRLQFTIAIIGHVHQLLQRAVNHSLLFCRISRKDSPFFAQRIVHLAYDTTRDITALNRLAIIVFVNRRRRGAKHRADVDIHNRAIRVVRRKVDTEQTAKVIRSTHQGAQVGVSVFSGIGHLS